MQSAKRVLKGAPVPNQVADAMGAHRPCPEPQQALPALKQRQQVPHEAVRLIGVLEVQAAAQRVAYVGPVAFTDAQDDPAHLGKRIEDVCEKFPEPLIQGRPTATAGREDPGAARNRVGC